MQVPALCAPAIPSHSACVPRQPAPLGSLGLRKKQLFLQQFPEIGAKGKRQYAFRRVDYNTQNALLLYLCEVAPGHLQLRKRKVINHLRTSLSSMHCLQEDSFFRRGLSSSPIGVRRDPQTPLPSFLCAKAVAHFRWKRQGEGAGFTDPVGGRRRCRCLGAVQRRLGVVRGVCCDRLYCTYRGDRASATVVDVRPPLDVGPRKEHAPRTPTISPSSARQRGQSERSQDADGVRDLYLSPRRPGPGHWRMVSGRSECLGKGR
ncbi:hypothetical protein I79_020371 [Cricetulus griseus]|uniref:Uncharacterized protein n=1 Tax=Cricetulus griseus TaxID=10029 RepID=G3I9W0_CRIGR|nr:hypothetical protein I79_020371 [Cricetulus griseus]